MTVTDFFCKGRFVLGMLAILVLLSPGLQAHEGESHGDSHEAKKAAKAAHDSAGKDVQLQGHLVGLTCFIKHGATGDSHKSCARQCAEKGLPIGLKDSSGKIYMVTGKGHDSLTETYKPLLKYLESEVKVQGKAFEKDGLNMLTIEKIKNS